MSTVAFCLTCFASFWRPKVEIHLARLSRSRQACPLSGMNLPQRLRPPRLVSFRGVTVRCRGCLRSYAIGKPLPVPWEPNPRAAVPTVLSPRISPERLDRPAAHPCRSFLAGPLRRGNPWRR